MLPRFALGNWWSRYYKYSEESYNELMDKFQEERIALSLPSLRLDSKLKETLEETQRRIAEDVRRFNETTGEPYRLSLSMGGAEYDGKSTEGFLSAMDKAMYAAKKEYYQTHEKGDAK